MLITMIDAGKVRKNSRGFINIDFRGEMRKTVSGGKEMCKTGRHKTPFPWRKPNRTTQLQIDCSDEMEFSEKFMACHQDDLTQSLRVVKEVAKLFKYNTPKPPVRSQLKINKIEHEGHRDSLQAS